MVFMRDRKVPRFRLFGESGLQPFSLTVRDDDFTLGS